MFYLSVGRKVYYEISTGDVILIVPEKNAINAINTTKDQDFLMFDVLQARDKDQVEVIQLKYGEKRVEFEQCVSVKVDIETKEIHFQYPKFEPSPAKKIDQLQNENADLIFQNAMQDMSIKTLQDENAELMFRLANIELGGI